jgi:hypothetical protein
MGSVHAALLLALGLLVLPQRATAAGPGRGPDLHGIVSAVDAAQRTITLTETVREGREQEFTYAVAEGVRVTLPGTPPRTGRLADLARGTPVALQLAGDRKTVIGIRAGSRKSDAEPLEVAVRPLQERVGLNQPFEARLRVVNASAAAQSFRVMNCSWDEHWRSSNPRVSWVGWDCAKNFATTVTLAPGQAYEKALSLLVLAGAPGEKVSFRLGFTPIGSRRTYWSNEVTVQVRPK